jgi:hypothetical protein
MNAKKLLNNEQSAIAIFTDGRSLTINADGTGNSGVWKTRKDLIKDKVIIYFRNPSTNKNEIYVGDFCNLKASDIEGLEHRFYVVFNNLNLVGETDNNWYEFVGTKKGNVNPIKYF